MLPGRIAARKLSWALMVMSVALSEVAHLERGLDHADEVHLLADVHHFVAGEQRVESGANLLRQVVALGPDDQVRDLPLGQDVAGGGEEVVMEMDVEVGEELGHRVGAHVLDPGEVHREVKVDGGDDEGGLARLVQEVEDHEGAVA